MKIIKIENGEIVNGIEYKSYPTPKKDDLETEYTDVILVGGWGTRLKKYRTLNLDKVLKDGKYIPIEELERIAKEAYSAGMDRAFFIAKVGNPHAPDFKEWFEQVKEEL